MTTWHYLAVRKHSHSEMWIEMHEVYLDREGRLDCWTDGGVRLTGNDVPDLILGLRHMLSDVVRWGIVDEAQLRVGATLGRRTADLGDKSANELVAALRAIASAEALEIDRRKALHQRLADRRLKGRRQPKHRSGYGGDEGQ